MSLDISAYDHVNAPKPTHRLVPSRYPPIDTFDAVASADDLEAVLELEGWTNDRLSAPRLSQLDKSDWVYGRPNASIVMAAFLHGSPTGMRFSDPELGAWYCSSVIATAVLEVANGMRKEMSLSALTRLTQTYRQYTAELTGSFLDILGRHPEFHDPDDQSYPVAQRFGRKVRELEPSQGIVGLRYESVRHPGRANWVCFRPRAVTQVTQAAHLEIDVPKTGRVVVRQLT